MFGETGAPIAAKPRLVVGPVVHRVVGDVDDVVAARRPIGQHRGDARHRVGAAIDDAIEVDQEEEAHGPIVAARPSSRTIGPMPSPDRDPLAATQRLLVDGTNLLFSLSRTSGAAPAAALIGRLRAIIPAHVTIELVFDGPPERGLRNERIAAGTVVRYGGGRTADAVILSIVDDVRMLDGADGTAGLLIVTDDRDLKYGARMRGARTAGSAWLLGRLGSGRLSSPSIGNPRAATRLRRGRRRRTAARPATRKSRTASGGIPDAARRPNGATRSDRPRPGGLVGCRGESRRRR